MKPNINKSFLPPITNNNHIQSTNSRSPTNIIREKKEKIDNKFPNIKFMNNSQEIKKTEDTNSYIEEMKKGTYNILVCVRCRPLSSLEYQLSTYETIRIMDNKMVVLMDPIEYNGPNTIFKNRSREQTYAFDFAFDKYTSQKVVFENSTKFLIDGVLNGYNATVFAYGATGAGKTYTMLGTEMNPGIMSLTLNELFNKLKILKSERQYKLRFWYLEIYNENIRDLLRFMNQKNNTNVIEENDYLDLREDPIKGIVVSGITEINVNNSNDMLKILKRGNRNRTQESTGANETSSRSHAILQVSIEYKDKNTGIDLEIKYSKLSLIDLAGSERASATQNRGIRLIEGANINRSLLTLGNCINALCDAVSKGIKKPYVPYRDSKLTRLLKDSLGGNARTVMIANISPAINAFDDTYNTLKYANRAKNIKTVVTRNVVNAQYHISNYVNIINNLKEEIDQLKQQIISKNNLPTNESLTNNNSLNNVDGENKNKYFENEDKFVENYYELKELCKSQIEIKQKIISTRNEINKLAEIIEINKDISTLNNGITFLINQTDNTSNNSNLNKSDIPPKNIDNNTNQILDNENDRTSKFNHLKEKMETFQQNLISNQNKFQEINTLYETILNTNYKKYKYSDIQKELLEILIKLTNSKNQIIDNKYANIINKVRSDIKDEYIEELEKQIECRDEIIKNCKDSTSKINTFIKELDDLKNDYKNKIEKAYLSQNISVLQLSNLNISIPYNCSLTNPNSILNEQTYNTINNQVKRSGTQSKKKVNNSGQIKSNKNKNFNNNFNRIPSNYLHSNNNNNNNSGLVKNSSFAKIAVKKYQSNNNLNSNPNMIGINKINIISNNNSPLPVPISNRLFGKNNLNNIKRNPKSFITNNKEQNIIFKPKNNEKGKRHKSAIGVINGHSHSNSYNEEDYYYICNKNNINYWSDRLMTAEQMPQFKKSDINNKINEKNLKRQKLLDKMNSDIKDLL